MDDVGVEGVDLGLDLRKMAHIAEHVPVSRPGQAYGLARAYGGGVVFADRVLDDQQEIGLFRKHPAEGQDVVPVPRAGDEADSAPVCVCHRRRVSLA